MIQKKLGEHSHFMIHFSKRFIDSIHRWNVCKKRESFCFFHSIGAIIRSEHWYHAMGCFYSVYVRPFDTVLWIKAHHFSSIEIIKWEIKCFRFRFSVWGGPLFGKLCFTHFEQIYSNFWLYFILLYCTGI